MTKDMVQKIKRALTVLFLVVAGFITLLILATIYYSTGQNNTRAYPGTSMGMPMMDAFYSGSGYLEESSESVKSISYPATSPSDTSGGAGLDGELVDRKLMQNGYLELTVPKVEDSITALTAIADNLGGSVDSVQFYNSENSGAKNATVVFRVPAVNFNEGMREVKALALKVGSENVTTSDVTEQFIDMQARLKNLKAQEEQYQAIMKKAVKVEDVISVSQQLFYVREQIDQIQGQMNYLSRQVDMSAITVSLSSDPEVSANVIWHPWTTIKEAARGFVLSLYALLRVIIFAVLFLIPILIIWFSLIGLVAWVVWKLGLVIYRRAKK